MIMASYGSQHLNYELIFFQLKYQQDSNVEFTPLTRNTLKLAFRPILGKGLSPHKFRNILVTYMHDILYETHSPLTLI